jgi:hypothetical protein
MFKNVIHLFLLYFLSSWTMAQNCSDLSNFRASTTPNTINWQQFPDFSLPFTIVYGGYPVVGDQLLPLRKGMTHLATYNPGEGRNVPVKNRATLWYNVADIAGTPWRDEESPWGNNLTQYQNRWQEQLLGMSAQYEGGSFPKTDIFVLDVERALTQDRQIRELKNSPSVPASIKSLPDTSFTERYKREMLKRYVEPITYIKTKGFDPAVTKLGSYDDPPISNEEIPTNYDWKDWTTQTRILNYLCKDTLTGKLGGPFFSQQNLIMPSVYFCYEGRNSGALAAGMLFFIEVNRAWTQKDIVVWQWTKYNRCQPTTNYNFDTDITASQAEMMAILPFFSGANGIWLWENPAFFRESRNLATYEYFIKGLYRLSQFKDFFTGTPQIVIPKTAHELVINREPIWRAVIKDKKILVAAHNPYASANQETTLNLQITNWQQTIRLRGQETFLCQFDVPNLITSTEDNFDFLLYPNPSNGQRFSLDGLSPKAIVNVFDIHGKEISVKEISNNSLTKIFELEVTTGVFLVKVQDGERTLTKTLLMNR